MVIVQHRIANGAIAMSMVDRTYGYDNSVDDRDPKKLSRTKEGKIFKTYADLKIHEWGQMMIEELAAPAKTAREPNKEYKTQN